MDILLTLSDLRERFKVSEVTFKKIKTQPGFPKPVRLSDNSHPRWRESDIATWLEGR